MTKRQIRKAAYHAIVKENKSHQEAFDELRKTRSIELDTLADEVSKIPSPTKQKNQQTLRYIFIGLLSLVIILRILAVLVITSMENVNINLLLVAIVLGLVIPAVGIFGALTSRVELYQTTGILLILSVIRSFTSGPISTDPIDFIVLIPFLGAAVLAFYIPTRLKTNYSKKVLKQEVAGEVKTSLQFTFDSPKYSTDNELIDTDL